MKTESTRKSFKAATGVLLLGLLVYTALIYWSAPWIAEALEGGSLVVVQGIIAILPGVLWLAIFYHQDRQEPEPKHYVLGVFLLGAVLAKLIALPLIHDVFAVDAWLYRNRWTTLVGAILVIGVIQEFVKYAAVRYTVYGSREFDEPLDGVIYSGAAGLGFATMLNIDYVIAYGGVDLQVGIVRMVVTALAHASFAGVLGYVMGQAKFRPGSDTLPLLGGVALVSVLNGLFFLIQGEVTTRGLEYRPWNGLIAAAVLAGASFGAVYFLMGRARARGDMGLVAETKRYYLREDAPVLVLVLVFLLGGFAVRGDSLGATQPWSAPGIGLQADFPSGWIVTMPGADHVKASSRASGSAYRTRIEIRREPLTGDADLGTLAMGRAVRLANELPFFRQLEAEAVTVAGRQAMRIEFAFVADSHEALLMASPLPVIVRAEEYLVLDGADVVRIRFTADNAEYAREARRLQRILETLRFDNGRV